MIRFSVTILISAFLLFQVQPLIARYILPWFGGTPAVWNTCMLFFQLLLLVGYAYSHVMTSRVKPKTQAIIHIVLLLAALAFLPIIPDESLKPTGEESPTMQILILLGITIGLPYVLLSTTGPLVQAWFARSFPGRSPYRLFALSNFGSLVALVSYPFVFEPRLRLNDQATLWSWGFLAFVLCCCWSAISTVYLLRPKVDAKLENDKPTDKLEAKKVAESAQQLVDVGTDRKPGPIDMLLWIMLSAVPSVLLLASTSQLCQEVAVVAFLWVLPLSLYLLSFIICFDNPYWYQRVFFGVLLIVSLVLAILSLFEGMSLNLTLQLVAFSTALFAACMTCHGELAASKPAPQHLTLFYLMVSVGGALGGGFVVIIAPLIFVDYWELHAGYVAALVLTGVGFARNGKWNSLKLVLQGAAVCGLLCLGFMLGRWPQTFFAEGNFGYRAMLAASVGAVTIFGLLGFGVNAGAFWKEGSSKAIDKKPDEYRAGESAALSTTLQTTLFIAISLTVGILITIVAAIVLLKFPEKLQKYADGWQQVVMLGVALAIVIASVRYLFQRFLPNAFSTTPSQWAHHALHFSVAMFVLTGFAAVLYREASDGEDLTIERRRDFYGTLKVREHYSDYSPYRKLMNGRTLHGQQYMLPDKRKTASGYYLPGSGVGLAITEHPMRKNGTEPMKLGVVGLGIGTLAAYGREGDIVRFYEINSQVEEVAREYFYYLEDSPAEIQIAVGDARIEMERELKESGSQQFDVLAIDAFSSDAIPRHLLTAEAIGIYLQHLKPDGILAIHISNRHLELEPIVYTLVRREGLIPGYFDYQPEVDTVMTNSSKWVLVARNEGFWSSNTVLNERGNSTFVMNRLKELPEIEERFGFQLDYGQPTLNVNDANREMKMNVAGTRAEGQILIKGRYEPGDPDALIVIDGKQYPLHSNLDEKYYWTDDFGSLWDVTR